jgi:hypothetical protein
LERDSQPIEKIRIEIFRWREYQLRFPTHTHTRQSTRDIECKRNLLQLLCILFVEQKDIVMAALADEPRFLVDLLRVELFARRGEKKRNWLTTHNLVAPSLPESLAIAAVCRV